MKKLSLPLVISVLAVLLSVGPYVLAQIGAMPGSGGTFGYVDLQAAGACIAGASGTVRLCGNSNALGVSANGGAVSAISTLTGGVVPTTQGGTGAATLVSRIDGFCSGTATSSQTLFLQYYPTTTCTITSAGAATKVLVSSAGTIRNLNVLAGTAGNASGSGVVTINKNGTGTAVTCTVGTGTTCSDTTHTAATAAGDYLTVSIVTLSTESLANVSIAFEY